MTNLKIFWLFIFLNYTAYDAAAQSTSPAALAESHVEALSQNNLEIHVKGNLSGHIELTTLEVILTTLTNNETSTDTIYEKGKTSEESRLSEDILENPFNSEENVGYSSEDKSSDVNVYLQSASPLSYTDNSENDEEAAAKELTDGFKSNDVINGSETSGNFVAINEEHGSETPVTNRGAPLSENYNFMNDADEKDVLNAADEGISSTETNDEENLFTESDEESDESLFELNDPTEENWFGINLEEEANTYSPSESISELEDIRKLLTQTSAQVPLDLLQYSTEISVIETVNGQRIERKLQNNETHLAPDNKDILTMPSTNYSEEINDIGENIENSDSLSISENVSLSEPTTSIENLQHDSNELKTELEESDTVEIILEGSKDEYINEDDKSDKTISPATILFPQNMEEPQPKTPAKINTNEKGDTTEIYILENNEDLVTIAAGDDDLSIEETVTEAVSDSAESDEDGPKIYLYNFSTENPNENVPSEINEDRIEQESIQTDIAYTNEGENVPGSITEGSVVLTTAAAFIVKANQDDDASENNSDYTKEDSTEILPVNIDTGFTIDKNPITEVKEFEFNPTTVQSIVDSFTDSISFEEDIGNKNNELPTERITVTLKQNNLEDVVKTTTVEYNKINLSTQNYETIPGDIDTGESIISGVFKDEEILEPEELVTTEIIDKNEKDSEVNSMENELTEEYFKIDGKLTTSMSSKEGSLLTTEITDVGIESSEFQATDSTISLNIEETDNILTSSETEVVETVNKKEKKIPILGTSEEFDIVEPEGLSNDISDPTNLSSMSTYSVESEEYVDLIEGDPKNIENIVIENQNKIYGINTENSNTDILSDKITDAAVLENADDSTTITNSYSDGSNSVENEEYVTEENQSGISEEFLSAPLESSSIENDRVTLDTDTASNEEVAESEITVQPTTEVNSDKTVLTEESDSVESEEYVTEDNQRGISEELLSAPLESPSIENDRVTLDTDTASNEEVAESEITVQPTTEVNSDKTVLTEESDLIESEEYVTEENQKGISEEFPSAPLETPSIERDRETLDTETALTEEVTESEITVKPTTEINSDKIILSEESDLVESEENTTEKKYQEFSSNETISDTLPLIDSTEAAPKEEEMEKGITFAPTEVNADEIIQSEESDSVESEEDATEEHDEGILKEFPANRNLSDPVKGVYEIDENSYNLNNFFTGLETSTVEANRAAADTETASKEEEIESEITLELTTKVTTDKIIQSEKSDTVEREEIIIENKYEGVPEEFPSNGYFPDIFPSIYPAEIAPVESIHELEETNSKVDNIFLTTETALKEEERVVTLEPVTSVTTDKIIQSMENISEILELNEDSQNVTRAEAEVTISNGTLDVILKYVLQQILTNIRNANLTENRTSLIKDENEDNYSDEDTTEEDDEENKLIRLLFENEDEDESDITYNSSEEIYSDESDTTAEDLSDGIISDEDYAPYINGKVFDNDVNVTIKIVAEETTFYVPPYAYLLEDLNNLVLNITWASSNKILNNSLSFTLTQISKYYVINGVQLNIVRDNEMLIWKKNVVILPKKTGKPGVYDCTIEFEDGVEVFISNINFLSKSSEKENGNNSDVHSSTSEMKEKRMYHIEIAVGCMAIALMLIATIYFAIRKAKKRTLKIKDLSAQHVAA